MILVVFYIPNNSEILRLNKLISSYVIKFTLKYPNVFLEFSLKYLLNFILEWILGWGRFSVFWESLKSSIGDCLVPVAHNPSQPFAVDSG